MDVSSGREEVELRRLIKKFFSSRSFYLAEESLNYFVGQLANVGREQRQKLMSRVAQLFEQNGAGSELLTLEQLKEMLKEVNRQKKSESEIQFKVETAVEWLKTLFEDKHRLALKLADQNARSPWDKLSFDAYRQRFELIRALIEEGPFNPVDSMLTRRGSKVRILAQLCRGTDGNFTAEDSTGNVRLHLEGATYQDGLYFEGGTFVFEGICSATGERVDVECVKLPRIKTLEKSEEIGIGAEKSKKQAEGRRRDPNDRIVFMSDVHLDNDKVKKALYHILQGFSSSPPNAFVFCGHFLSIQQAHGYTEQALIAFRHFANIITEFSHNYPNTQFVVVPASEDPSPVQVLPRSPLLPSIQKCLKDVKNVHFASNPCKLIFKDQHIVIYRDDMVEKLCRSAISMPRNAMAKDIPKLFCDTIWSQRHFSPLPLFNNPIQPTFDPLFQLFPAPDVLVIADRFKSFFELDDERRRLTLNPGPFSQGAHFEFQVFFPALRRVEHSAFTEDETDA